MTVNKKQIIDLTTALGMFIIILILLLVVGLKTIFFKIEGDKEIFDYILKGFNKNISINNNMVTYGLKFFEGGVYWDSVHIIYAAEISIIFFVTLLLSSNIVAIFTSKNKSLSLINDITNKICLILIVILSIVVLINFDNFAKAASQGVTTKLDISSFTLALFIPLTIFLPLILLVFSTILNKDVYKNLKK